MGKKGKVGKQRKDNYYKLAKQKGFRSRAAFKLIQLNRKFQFLENSRVCIDLCAAPGGWLQVSSEYMPVSSVIIGVDLAPITPIRNVITFQSDITTIECSKTIEGKLQGWSADIVLHDGAPNVGKNWLHDSYNQNVLVLNALKIACTHLTKGGWFITKIFRSTDYNSLIWVFGKLFSKVHATKPQASRSESAEIFVVCQNYKKPDEIDPSFFDPTKLFADISEFDEDLKKRKADLLKPLSKIKKTKAHGYEDGDILKTVTDLQFVTSQNHMEYLAQCHELKLTNSEIMEHESTTEEIKECCKDLRVLGRKDLLKLLKWRRLLRKDLTSKLLQAIKAGTFSEDGETHENGEDFDSLTIRSDDDDVETVPELQLDDIEAQEKEANKKEAKRLKRKEEKRVRDYQQRVNYGMVNDGDVLIEEENDLFNLKKISGKEELEQLDNVDPDDTVETKEDPHNTTNDSAKQRKSVTFAREADCQYFERDEDYESDQDNHPSDVDGPEKPSESKIKVPKKILRDQKNSTDVLQRLAADSTAGGGLLTDLEDVSQSKISAAKRFFDRNVFTGIDLEDALETDLVDKIAAKRLGLTSPDMESKNNKRKISEVDLSRFDDGIGSDNSDSDNVDQDQISDSDDDEDKPRKKQIKLNPEGLALASMMVSSDKMRRDIEDEAWNRYAHADSHLAPKWFREEEEKYCRRNIPVRPELVKEYKEKLRDIDSKPIKKELQAKARKKRRAMRKMNKVRKKVEGITTNEDLTQKEQISQIKTVYKNATKTKKREVKVVVARKGLPAKKPTKGKYKMVDARMRKDLRGKQKRDGKGKQGKRGAVGGAKNKRKKRESNNSMGPPKSKGPAKKARSSKGGGSSKSRGKSRR